MPDHLDERIAAMDRSELLALWKEMFGRAAPASLSQPFMRRSLAWEAQMRSAGESPDVLRAEVTRVARAAERSRSPKPLQGGRLLREWNGITHAVEVTGDGYLWNGRSWRSLSAIARQITGAHWSGPRFFGLDRRTAVATGGSTTNSGRLSRAGARALTERSDAIPSHEDSSQTALLPERVS